jgi:hypothetical protein
MKRLRDLSVLAGAAILTLAGCSDDPEVITTNPPGNGVCLQRSLIDHTDILSDNTILFYMKDGKIWQNSLRFACPGLKLENGFGYEADASEICSNMQTIHVLRSGGLCEIGQFLPFTPPVLPKP